MKYISYSGHESNKFNLRIGRTSIIDFLDPAALVKEIFDLNLDVCRLKLRLSDPAVFQKLEALKLPYENYSLLIRQSIPLNKYIPENNDNGLEIRPYDMSLKDEMFQVVMDVMKNDINLYYTGQLYELLFSKEIVQQTVADYQTTFDNSLDKSKFGFLAYLDKQLIGFCTLQINGDEGEGVFVGLAPEFRSNNFFKAFVQTEIIQSKLSGCKTFNCNTIVFNTRSLHTTIKQGMAVEDAILNLNVFSLLNRDNHKSIKIKATTENLFPAIQKAINTIFFSGNEIRFINDFKLKSSYKVNSEVEWSITNPLNERVFLFFDEKKETYGYAKIEELD